MASLDSYLTLFSSSISLLFLLLFPLRFRQLRKQTIKVKPGGWRGVSKLVSTTSLALVQLITACISTPDSHHGRNQYSYFLLSGISPIAAFALAYLSSLEHRRSIRPSSLILVYLLSSLICDLVQLTAPSLRYMWQNGRHLYLVPQLFAKALVLVTELLLDKQPDLLEEWQTLPPEEKSSIFGRSLMWWMNTILARGYRNTLINEELPEIGHALSSRVLREKIIEIWSSDAASGSSPWLLSVAVKCFLRPGLLLVIWRISLIVFRYSQPVLITYSITFLNSASSSQDEGYFLVLAAIFIHAGYAFSVRAYQLGLNRLKVMLRGSLIGLIHQSSLVALPNESRKDTDKSNSNSNSTPVVLVTTDVTTLEDAVETFYMTWACTIEAIIGTVMLARQVGWVWPLPHLITIFCSRISAYVARNLKTRQAEWNAATRKRIAVTSSVLSSAKTVKMLGLQGAVERQILELRKEETDKAARVRWIRVVYNASANALGMFAPVVTIVVFAIIASLKGDALNPETAFPTIAILALVTHSANMVMTIIPKAVAAYPSFERIQSYLQPTDLRTTSFLHPVSRDRFDPTIPAILIKDLSITWNNGQEALRDINLSIPKGSIVACCGPVGSGKTTLARTILGEIRVSNGVVETSTGKMAYCAQTAWLPNRTIKEVIYGPAKASSPGLDENEEDKTWYETVLRACCLDEDFATTLPDGDATVVGNGGTNLSGGQRQRVALARAVFQRCEIAVLDDVFSALDGRTEKRVAENLFGTPDAVTGGLFRKLGTTVFRITSSTQHFHMTDYVVVLEAGGRIQEQGRWSDLKASEQQQISKLIHSHDSEENKEIADDTKSQKQQQLTPKSNHPDDISRRDGDSSLYGYYFTAAGLQSIILLFSCTASTAFFMTAPSYWIKYWTEDSLSFPQHQHKSTTFYATIYSLLALSAWISTNGIMSSQLLLVAPRASLTLHARLLHTILSAPLSYFSSTQSGTIINHFTQDISLVDKTIAPSFSSFSTQIFKLLFQFLVLFAVQPLIVLTLPVCFAVIYLVQRVYLRTSRQIRIIELESRSAVFSSLLETATGVETIRAFKWASYITDENVAALDLSQRPFYLLVCLQRWLGIVLNLLGGGIAVMVIALGVVFKGTTTGAQIGVALNVLLVTKDTLLKLVDVWTGLEIALGAVARLRGVEEGTPKEELELAEVEMGDGTLWPTEGKLELRGVSASYSDDSLALRDINLQINPGETVAVCGRTGSGKSSLLLTLLRLLRLKSGSILVDGLDITHIPLSRVRQRCFVTIAQDPYFLHEASLRFNLDPSRSLSTSEVVRILDRVGLWSHLLATCGSNSRPSLASSVQVISADNTSSISKRSDDNSQDLEVDSGSSSIKTPTSPTNDAGNGNDEGNPPSEQTPLLSTSDEDTNINNNYFYTSQPQTPISKTSKASAILNTPLSQIPPLSAGQAQLLALARGIAQSQSQSSHHFPNTNSPQPQKQWKPIILLDEITSSLDAATEQTVCEIVEQEFIAKGHTVIMVTHRIGPFLDARRRMATLITSNNNKGKGLTVVWMKNGRVDKVERDVN